MSDEIIAKLNGRIDRRSFLRGSSLLAAAAGAALVLPGVARAQEPQASQPAGGQDGKPAEDEKKSSDAKDEPEDKKDAPAQQAREGDGAQTLIDSQGKPYRICPQCGANMYKQGRTWTCENCGYSYDE